MGEVCCWQNVCSKQTAKCSWEAEVGLLQTGQVSVVLGDHHQLASDLPAGLPGYRLGVTSEVNRIPKGRTPTQVRLEPLSNSCCLVCVSGGVLKAPERRSHCVSKAIKEGHPIHLWESITSHRCRHLEYRLVQGTGLKHFFFFIYLFLRGGVQDSVSLCDFGVSPGSYSAEQAGL